MSNWAGISTSVINDISPLLVVVHATCANDHFDRVIEYLYSKAYVIFVGSFDINRGLYSRSKPREQEEDRNHILENFAKEVKSARVSHTQGFVIARSTKVVHQNLPLILKSTNRPQF